MTSLNKAILIGNLGADPEVHYTQGGAVVANFRIATTEQWTDKTSGQRKERTEWHRIVVWGRQAEICHEFLCKGRSVYVEGRIQTREWEDRDGNKRYTKEIVAERILFLGSRRDGGGDSVDGYGGGGGRAVRSPGRRHGGGGFEASDGLPTFADSDLQF